MKISYFRTIAMVSAWASIEYRVLEELNIELTSPELTRTTMWCISRLYGAMSDDTVDRNSRMRLMKRDRGFANFIIEFLLRKSFAIFNKLSGETK